MCQFIILWWKCLQAMSNLIKLIAYIEIIESTCLRQVPKVDVVFLTGIQFLSGPRNTANAVLYISFLYAQCSLLEKWYSFQMCSLWPFLSVSFFPFGGLVDWKCEICPFHSLTDQIWLSFLNISLSLIALSLYILFSSFADFLYVFKWKYDKSNS